MQWKSDKFTYSGCVCSFSYPACNAHALYSVVICDLSDSTIFLSISLKRHDFTKEKGLFNIKFTFSFSLQLLSENFPVLRIIKHDTAINVHPYVGIHMTCPLFLSHFNET